LIAFPNDLFSEASLPPGRVSWEGASMSSISRSSRDDTEERMVSGASEHAIVGVLQFFSETGTEGGSWAFQDRRFIRHNVGMGYCRKCGKWLRRRQYKNIQVERVSRLDPEAIEEIERVGTAAEPPYCHEREHEEQVGDAWDYEGLHILRDGDRLTIYDRADPSKIVWDGTIRLKRYKMFTQDAFGLWIHADQEGVPRETWAQWFLKQYPARLVPDPSV